MHLLDRQLSPPGGDRLYRQAKGAGRDLHHGPRQHGPARARGGLFPRDRLSHLRRRGIFSLWGDITAWGIDGIPDHRVSAQDFIDLVREKDGFCVSCHPFRSNNRGLREHLRDVHSLDGVEVLNGSTPLEENRTALRFCRELGLKAIGASDAHVPEQVGKYVTWLPETVTTLPDFVTALHTLETRPAIWTGSGYDVVTGF